VSLCMEERDCRLIELRELLSPVLQELTGVLAKDAVE